MAAGTYFVRSCPTCGRHLEIRVSLLGRDVECPHCSGTFVASEEFQAGESDLRIERILERAQKYIDSVNTAPSE